MKQLKRLAILIAICLIAVYSFVQSGLFNVAATVKDSPIMTWLMHTTMDKSVERRAQNIEVPDIKNNEMILAGLSDYVEMCAQCHGEPDKPSSIIRQGLNPAPPDLEDLTEDVPAAEMFWIVKNGIRMTGMPAFGKTHQADEIWPVVAFLQSAKDITSSEYKQLKKEAEGHGHHNHHEVDDGHNDHDADASSTITSDSQISDIAPLHQEEGNHDDQHNHND